MKTAIFGAGQIGTALENVLEDEYDISLFDINNDINENYQIIHICFPYNKYFEKEVKKYQKQTKAKYTVIHSTVPVGTSKKLGAWHSPVIGIHPNLENGIRTFDKFLGGKNDTKLINYFRRAGIKIYPTQKAESTELMKILCTTYYGVCIEYTKEVNKLCKTNKVPFELWTLWNNNYNKGYKTLNQEQFIRPNLIPMENKIGGHCVLSNTKLIKSKFARFISELNE